MNQVLFMRQWGQSSPITDVSSAVFQQTEITFIVPICTFLSGKRPCEILKPGKRFACYGAIALGYYKIRLANFPKRSASTVRASSSSLVDQIGLETTQCGHLDKCILKLLEGFVSAIPSSNVGLENEQHLCLGKATTITGRSRFEKHQYHYSSGREEVGRN